MYFGVYFGDQRGFVFCTGCRRSQFKGRPKHNHDHVLCSSRGAPLLNASLDAASRALSFQWNTQRKTKIFHLKGPSILGGS